MSNGLSNGLSSGMGDGLRNGMNDVLIHQSGPVLHLTLNRPAQRNPLSWAMVQALGEALAAAEADGSTRIVVLRGAGGHFCSGGDVADMAAAWRRSRGHQAQPCHDDEPGHEPERTEHDPRIVSCRTDSHGMRVDLRPRA